FSRADERLEAPVPSPVVVDPSPLIGCWINTNTATPGLDRVIVSRRGDDLTIRVTSASGPTPREWGDAGVDTVYATGVGATAALALLATYDFGFLETRVEANLSLGLLVVATFNTFRDGSGRSNFFGREFFYDAGKQPAEESVA